MPNTIKIKKYLDIIEEYVAASAITPGELIEVTSANTVQAHSSAGQNILQMVALEDELQGKSITDDYAAADPVQCWVTQRGEIAYLILNDGENVVIGDFLESAGNGNVQKHVPDFETGDSSGVANVTVYSNQIVGVAVEAVNLSASSGAESSALQGSQRIKVRIS